MIISFNNDLMNNKLFALSIWKRQKEIKNIKEI
jgi:hypothetical protein